MIKYLFTGHLTPRPAGTERAMCQLSGEVYLAVDVEKELQDRTRTHECQIAELHERIRKLTRRTMGFRKRKQRSVSAHEQA